MSATSNVLGFIMFLLELHGCKSYFTVYQNGFKTDRECKVNVNLDSRNALDIDLNVMVRQSIAKSQKRILSWKSFNLNNQLCYTVHCGACIHTKPLMQTLQWPHTTRWRVPFLPKIQYYLYDSSTT